MDAKELRGLSINGITLSFELQTKCSKSKDPDEKEYLEWEIEVVNKLMHVLDEYRELIK